MLYYYVIREYSKHASRKTLWQVMSRRFPDLLSANDFKDFRVYVDKQEKVRRKYKYDIIMKEEQT